jgi:tetratricopeptide (TPR) repeat protein
MEEATLVNPRFSNGETAMFSARVGRHSLLAVLALLATAWVAAAAPAPDEDKDLRKQALKLNDITGDDPIKGQIQALVADAAGTKKLLKVALAMTKEKDQPFNYNALYILANAAYQLRDAERAETFYRLAAAQALELKSGSKLAQSYFGLIVNLYQQKKFAACEKVCTEVLELPTDDDTVARLKLVTLMRLGMVYAKEKKFDEANKLTDRLLKAGPDDWQLLELKGFVQREEEKYDDAAKTYEDVLKRIDDDKALKDDEKKELSAEVRYRLSDVYLELNKLDKVTEELQTLIKQEPDDPTFYNDLGYIWADHDLNLPKAEEYIRKALELDREQRKKAKLSPEQDKDNGAYLDSLGWVLYKQKKYAEAEAAMLQAVKDKDAQHVEIYDHLGDVYMALDKKADALAAYKKGVEVAGDTKKEQDRKAAVEKKIKAADKK